MKLKLSPQVGLPGQPETRLSVSGDTVIVDGVSYDAGEVPEGGEGRMSSLVAAETPFVPFRKVTLQDGSEEAVIFTRQNGEISCIVRVILGDDAANDQPTDPEHWQIDAGDGPVTIPAVRKEEEAT